MCKSCVTYLLTETCKACYFHIRVLRHIRASLTTEASKTIAAAIVGSRLLLCACYIKTPSDFYISTPILSLITWIFCLLLYFPDVVYFIAYNYAITTLYVHHLRLTNVIKAITYLLTYLLT